MELCRTEYGAPARVMGWYLWRSEEGAALRVPTYGYLSTGHRIAPRRLIPSPVPDIVYRARRLLAYQYRAAHSTRIGC
eukprot:1364468-Rhodomonas_salina.1